MGLIPAGQRFDNQENTRCSLPLVSMLDALRMLKRYWNRFSNVAQKLGRLFVHTNDRKTLGMQFLIDSKELLHRRNKGIVCLRRNDLGRVDTQCLPNKIKEQEVA